MDAEIQKIKNQLKKTETNVTQLNTTFDTRDKETCDMLIENNNVEFSNEEIKRIKEERFDVNMEEWINQFSNQETVPTSYFKLTTKEGASLFKSCKKIDKQYPVPDKRIEELTEETIEQNLNTIETKIDELIKKYSNSAFVKLSCRSAKDVTIIGKRFEEKFEEKINFESEKNDSTQFKLKAAYESSLEALKVFSGKEALDLLLESKRISFDLALDLKFWDDFDMSVIVRQWKSFPLITEFRIFVNNKKITAISQYYTQIYFKELIEQKDEYKDLILDFYEKIESRLKFESYVVDFGVFIETKTVLILELNPFHPSTGGALFDWISDGEILDNGPLEFRVLQKPLSDEEIKEQIIAEWVPLVFG